LDVQAQLVELFKDRIVIGHGFENDLRAISKSLPSAANSTRGVVGLSSDAFRMSIRDTQKYRGYQQYASPGAHQGPNLKSLALKVLGRSIKEGRVPSVEDAVATMELYRHAEAEIDKEQGK
jgi:RNA exonuclease 4